MATLAASIEQLIQLNAGLTQSVSSLAQRQTQLEKRSDPALQPQKFKFPAQCFAGLSLLPLPFQRYQQVQSQRLWLHLHGPRLLPHWDSCHRHNFSLQISWGCRRRSPNRSSISLQII